jgi:hypothetical protein
MKAMHRRRLQQASRAKWAESKGAASPARMRTAANWVLSTSAAGDTHVAMLGGATGHARHALRRAGPRSGCYADELGPAARQQ